jgi:hypothetical protein
MPFHVSFLSSLYKIKRNPVCGSHCGIVSSATKFRTDFAYMWCGRLIVGIVRQFSLQPYYFIIKSIDFCLYPVTCLKGLLKFVVGDSLCWSVQMFGQLGV